MRFSAVRLLSRNVVRALSHHCQSSAAWKYEELTSRGLIEAGGRDSMELLQGLTTNDMKCLGSCPVIYSLLLNIKGRVLYDVLIYSKATGEAKDLSFLVECDRSIIPDIMKHFKMYKLRKKVQLQDVSTAVKVWCLLPRSDDQCSDDGCRPEVIPEASSNIVSLTADPRVQRWSARLLLPADVQVPAVIRDSSPASPGSYTAARYALGVGEGVADFPVGSSLPLECNGAQLHGVSFNKGCYLGQELTARSHHTGVIRKRLMPLQLLDMDAMPGPNSEVLDAESDKAVGRTRRFVAGRGLGLLRLSSLKSTSLKVRCSVSSEEFAAKTWVPTWWPENFGVKFSDIESS